MHVSLQSRDLEAAVVPAARELGPSTHLTSSKKTTGVDRFLVSGDKLEASKAKVAKFFDIAKAKNCTPAQLALAWVHAQGNDVFPIPGTKTSTRIVENAQAVTIKLSPEDVQAIAAAAESIEGARYSGPDSTFNAHMDHV
ncbi:hypothetical protein AC1031_007574 [Aphanomyces cochlioides]|nr:hypothetical protein AC1031_007574 [Aphanomyces cochlioides]